MKPKRAIGCVAALAATAALVSATPTSAQAAGSTLDIARGVVTSSGSPVSGAAVHTFIWPNAAKLGALADGATVPTFNLSGTTTNASGQYFVPMASPGSIPAMYKESDGSVSVETDVITGGHYLPVSDSVKYSSAAGAWQDSETGIAVTTNSGMTMDFASGTVQNTSVTSVDVGEAFAPDAYAATTTSDVMVYSGDVTAAGTGTCTWQAGTKHLGRPEHFMDVNTWQYAQGRVTEGSHSTHTLGIGVTSDGFANLHEGGTATLTLNSDTGNVVSQGSLLNQSVSNKVNARDYKLVCPLGPTGDGRRRPYQTYAFLDASLQHGISHTYYFASNQGVGATGTFSTTTAHATSMKNGFDIGPINVYAQSGYSVNTDLTIHFSRSGFIGGSNVAGPHNSGSVDSRSFK